MQPWRRAGPELGVVDRDDLDFSPFFREWIGSGFSGICVCPACGMAVTGPSGKFGCWSLMPDPPRIAGQTPVPPSPVRVGRNADTGSTIEDASGPVPDHGGQGKESGTVSSSAGDEALGRQPGHSCGGWHTTWLPEVTIGRVPDDASRRCHVRE
jgi:hypothetical protein